MCLIVNYLDSESSHIDIRERACSSVSLEVTLNEEWFDSPQARSLLHELDQWASSRTGTEGGAESEACKASDKAPVAGRHKWQKKLRFIRSRDHKQSQSQIVVSTCKGIQTRDNKTDWFSCAKLIKQFKRNLEWSEENLLQETPFARQRESMLGHQEWSERKTKYQSNTCTAS